MASTKTVKQLKQLLDSVAQSKTRESNNTKKQRRSRKGRSRKLAKLENRLDGVGRYIRSIYDDFVVGDCQLPSPNYNGPYRRHLVTGRFQLNLANTASLHADVVVNPWLLWTNQFVFEKTVAGVPVQCNVPSIYQHSLVSISAGLPDSSVSAVQAVALDSVLGTTNQSSWSGKIRCTGVHFRIYYTGTFANRGGTILAITNSERIALAGQFEGGGAGTQPITVFDTAAELTNLTRCAQMLPIGDEFSFTWRPNDLEFVDVSTYVPNILDGLAGTNGNSEVIDYLPERSIGASTAPKGWVTGFELRPASGAAGTVANYFCEITAEYDLAIRQNNNTSNSPGISPYVPDRKAVIDPIAHAKAANAIADLHDKRSKMQYPPGAKSLAVRAEHMVEKYGGKVARNTAVEALGARVAAMF